MATTVPRFPQNQLDPPEDTETALSDAEVAALVAPQNQLDPPEDTETAQTARAAGRVAALKTNSIHQRILKLVDWQFGASGAPLPPQNQLDPPEDTETTRRSPGSTVRSVPSKPTRSTRGY